MSATPPRVIEQLRAAGLLDAFTDYRVVDTDDGGTAVRGTVYLNVIDRLRADHERFASGPFHGLHADVGEDRVEFRSYSGTFGRGSLQVVIDRETGNAYADVDGFNPYQDVVNVVGHTLGEVLPHGIVKLARWFGGLVRRRRKDG